MKKLLNMLVLTTLSTSAIPTVNLVLNSSVVKNLSLKDTPVKDNPFKTPMTGTSGKIMSLSVDNQGNIYAGSYSSGVYKSNGTDPNIKNFFGKSFLYYFKKEYDLIKRYKENTKKIHEKILLALEKIFYDAFEKDLNKSIKLNKELKLPTNLWLNNIKYENISKLEIPTLQQLSS